MKKLIKSVFSKVSVVCILVLIQVAILWEVLIGLSEYAAWINVVLAALSVLILLFVINKSENSGYKIGWVLMIALLPVFGGLLYVFFGNKRPSRKMRARVEEAHASVFARLNAEDRSSEIPGRGGLTSTYIYNNSGFPARRNSRTEYFPLGELMFERMLSDIRGAEKFIFLEYFIISEGEMWRSIESELIKKAGEGVDIRIIYDDIGSAATLPKGFERRLRHAGIRVVSFNPLVPLLSLVMNNRDHRKILVVDGRVAYTGGINIADEYINRASPYGHWKDGGIRISGSAVGNMTAAFLELWEAYGEADTPEALELLLSDTASEDGDGSFVQPFADSPLDEEPLAENVYMEIINRAEKYVYITTPYLILDDEMTRSLTLAAKRGVDVRIITPGIPDKKIIFRLTRSYYRPLITAGVKIYEYTPGFIHAKNYVSDDERAVVGTINMDYRSLYLHFECGCLIEGGETVLDIRRDFLETEERCRLVPLRGKYRFGMFIGKLFDSVLRVLSPLL